MYNDHVVYFLLNKTYENASIREIKPDLNRYWFSKNKY